MKLKLVILMLGLLILSSDFFTKTYGQNNNQSEKPIQIGYKNLRLTGNLTRGGDDPECADWTFSQSSLKNLLKSFKEASMHVSYVSCYQHSCWYTGEVSNVKKSYEITVYAGGYIILSNGEEALHFITTKNSDLFFSICDCCEVEEDQ